MMKKLKMMFGICCAIIFVAFGIQVYSQVTTPPDGGIPPGENDPCWDWQNIDNWGMWDNDLMICKEVFLPILDFPCWNGCDNGDLSVE